MTNLYNIKSLTLAGKKIDSVKTSEIDLAGQTEYKSTELVTMKAIEKFLKKSNTQKVEFIDMIQNACWYYDSTEPGVYNDVYTELYYGFKVSVHDDRATIASGSSTNLKSTVAFIPKFVVDIATEKVVAIMYIGGVNINFLGEETKLVVSDDIDLQTTDNNIIIPSKTFTEVQCYGVNAVVKSGDDTMIELSTVNNQTQTTEVYSMKTEETIAGHYADFMSFEYSVNHVPAGTLRIIISTDTTIHGLALEEVSISRYNFADELSAQKRITFDKPVKVNTSEGVTAESSDNKIWTFRK